MIRCVFTALCVSILQELTVPGFYVGRWSRLLREGNVEQEQSAGERCGSDPGLPS